MPKKDVLSWTAMIQGYVQYGHHDRALEFFSRMQIEGVSPNHITFGTVIGATAGLLDLELGREVHSSIINDGFQSDLNIGNALIDMYSRCGSLIDARTVFNGMPNRDAVTWNVMIGCCADHGNGEDVFELSQQMDGDGFEPDEFTVSSILSACRHAGMVCEACFYLSHALQSYDVMPSVHHYASMVDLLGRVGCLYQAAYFLNRIPFQPNVVVLMSFLSACKSHADADLAELFSDEMLNLASENMAAHVLLYNIFAGKDLVER
jgi:pentatricopeptide repeat protein